MDYKEIEKSIIKKYRKEIWSKFIKTVKEYELIQENDKIMVCISGGKDSFLLAKCMEELTRHGKIKFECKYVIMNPGYKERNLNLIKKNLKKLNIDAIIYDSDIFDIVTKVEESPCYLCARMRRGCLYSKAQELGCNKIALGHHFDDVIETNLLNIFYGSEIKTMLPKLHSTNFKGIDLIRPLYLVHEEDIISWKKYNKLEFLNCACKFTEENYQDIHDTNSKRYEIKHLIKELRKTNPNIEHNIFTSMNNINLNAVLGYKKDKEYISFLKEFDEYDNNSGGSNN